MLVVKSTQQYRIDKLKWESIYGITIGKLDAIQQVKNVTAVIVRDYAPNIVPPQVWRVWVDTLANVSYISIDTSFISDRWLLWNIWWSAVNKKVAVWWAWWSLTSYTDLEYDSATQILKSPYFNATNEYKVGWTKVVSSRQTANYSWNSQWTSYTGIDNAQAWNVYAQLSDLNALRVAYEALRTWFENMRTAMQTHGLIS